MFTEGALRIEVHRGTKVTVLDVQSDRALIGSGAHCDVRLAPDEAAVEQLTVETIDEGVYAKTVAIDRPCLLNGAPFLEGRVPATAMLEVGPVVICVKFAPREEQEKKKKANTSATPAGVQALALVGLAVGFYYVLGKSPDGTILGDFGVVSPPSLSVAAEPCPQADPVAARSIADESLTAAEMKRERAPFYPSDGLTAVRLFRRAAGCLRGADAEAAAREAERAADRLQQKLADELHVRHVRLERMLAEQKFADAKREGKLIAEFIADPTNPYSQWLSAVVREGELQAQQQGKP
jgi:hypothetical protein